MWSIHTTKYYTALKRKEVLTPATTEMKLEDIMLRDRSHTQKATYCMTVLIENVQNRHSHRDRQ